MSRFAKFFVSVAALYLVLSSTTAERCEARGKTIPPEAAQSLLAARAKCDAADQVIQSQVDTISERFASICRELGHYPTTEQLPMVRDQLRKLCVESPYLKDPILAQELKNQFPDTSSAPQMIIVKDLTLNENQLRQFRLTAPTDWSAPPGSVTIIYNDYDRFIVWAAGVTGKPLQDEQGQNKINSVVLPF